MQLSFRADLIIILLLSVQNLAVILILQMVMFVTEVHHQRRPMFSAPSAQC